MARPQLTGLDRVFSADLIAAIEQLVDERFAVLVVEHARRENGDRRQWLSMSEAAAELGVDPRTLRRHVERGRIRTTSLGRRRLVAREDLDALLRSQLK